VDLCRETKPAAKPYFNSNTCLAGVREVRAKLPLDCACRNEQDDGLKRRDRRRYEGCRGQSSPYDGELRDPEAFAKGRPRSRVVFERDRTRWEGVRVFMRLTKTRPMSKSSFAASPGNFRMAGDRATS